MNLRYHTWAAALAVCVAASGQANARSPNRGGDNPEAPLCNPTPVLMGEGATLTDDHVLRRVTDAITARYPVHLYGQVYYVPRPSYRQEWPRPVAPHRAPYRAAYRGPSRPAAWTVPPPPASSPGFGPRELKGVIVNTYQGLEDGAKIGTTLNRLFGSR